MLSILFRVKYCVNDSEISAILIQSIERFICTESRRKDISRDIDIRYAGFLRCQHFNKLCKSE